MNTKKVATLIINLGSPESPSTKDVRKYLTQFLNDKRVIDISGIFRFILVNFFIVPFRAPKSAKIYQELWTEKGSPLILYSNAVQSLLQEKLKNKSEVFLAMRYGNPSIEAVLNNIKSKNFDKIIIIPLYPQHASSSTGTVMEEVMRIISKWWVIPELSIISQFYDDALFIQAWKEIGEQFPHENYDHIVFSYHGLPERQLDKVYENDICVNNDCENEITEKNKFCYKATSYATTRLIAQSLNIPKNKYTVSFQSRLDNKWVKPYSDQVIRDLATNGMKKILVFSPAFVSDCLETIIEINHEYKDIFISNGGAELQMVPSLNTHSTWISCLENMVLERL